MKLNLFERKTLNKQCGTCKKFELFGNIYGYCNDLHGLKSKKDGKDCKLFDKK